jgi:hypothetical protein
MCVPIDSRDEGSMVRTSRPRIAVAALLVVVLLSTAGCAAGPNTAAATAGTTHPAGFWLGLWHGVICPIAFLVSLLNDHVNIYEVHHLNCPPPQLPSSSAECSAKCVEIRRAASTPQ